MANGGCRHHGGKALGGIGQPSYKDGKKSRNMPTRLLARFNEIMNDPNYLEGRESIALMDARVEDLLGRADSGESLEAWTKAKGCLDRRDGAREFGFDGEQEIVTLRAIIDGALGDYSAWRGIAEAVEVQRKLRDTERKRIADAGGMLKLEDILKVMGNMLDVVATHVTDLKVRQMVQDAAAEAFGRGVPVREIPLSTRKVEVIEHG
jgi:hypothetical protein